MKKRLRKKLRLGEFSELGFELRLRLREGLSESDGETAIDDFIREAVESRDLAVGGGYGEVWNFFVTRTLPGSVGADERAAVLGWLQADDRFTNVEASPLLDAWYQTWDWENGRVDALR